MSNEKTGRVTIAPEVLTTIVRQTTLAQAGVWRLSRRTPDTWGRLLGRVVVEEGIRVCVEDAQVKVDIYILALPNGSLLELGHRLQEEIAQAICHIVGLTVTSVNVYIENVAPQEHQQ